MSAKRELGQTLSRQGDNDAAAALLKSAIKEGDIQAINDYAVVKEREGMYQEARYFYTLAAIMGVKCAVTNIGNMYEQGYGVNQSYELAAMFYKRGVELKHPTAFYKLSKIYLYGKEVEKDLAKSLGLLEQGFEIEKQVNEGYQCAIQLGCAYDFGYYGEVDKDKALKYYAFAAKKGSTLAYFNMGCIYCYKGDEKTAIKLWMHAAKEGYADAYDSLFVSYWNGENGIKQEHGLALSFLDKAIKLRSYRAILHHADLLLDGELGDVDTIAAIDDIRDYLNNCKYVEDYWDMYTRIKEKHLDKLNWEDLENRNVKLFSSDCDLDDDFFDDDDDFN